MDPEKDVDVTVTDKVLHLAGKREVRKEEKDGQTFRSEFHYGEFARDLALPKGVDASAIDAQYHDGILEVRVPWPAKQEFGFHESRGQPDLMV